MNTAPPPIGVLLVTDALQPGGLERVVVDLAAGLAAQGHSVGVHAGGGGAFWDELPASVRRHPAVGTPTLRSLRRLLHGGQYDVVHAHQRKVAILARVAGARPGVPVVEHVHNVFPVTPVARLVSFRSPLLLACGSAVERMLEHDYGRSPDRIRLVLNGVRDPAAGGIRPVPSAARPDTLRLVGIGRLTEQKDPLRFLRLIAALRPLLGNTRLEATWIGDGPLREPVQQEIDRLGLTRVVALAGHREDVHRFLAEADALLLTSRWEGLPLVALEALAMGRGVVLPDVGSCADAVGDGSAGLLYDPSAPDECVAEMLAATLTPDRVLSWSVAARLRFETHFVFPRVLDQVGAAYREVLVPTSRRAGLPERTLEGVQA